MFENIQNPSLKKSSKSKNLIIKHIQTLSKVPDHIQIIICILELKQHLLQDPTGFHCGCFELNLSICLSDSIGKSWFSFWVKKYVQEKPENHL